MRFQIRHSCSPLLCSYVHVHVPRVSFMCVNCCGVGLAIPHGWRSAPMALGAHGAWVEVSR